MILMPLPAVGVLVVVDSANWPIREMWPVFPVLAVVAGLMMRPSVRLSGDELLIRYPIGSQRLRRSDVASAHFNYFGLVVQLRNGATAFAFLAPKPTSTELSSGGRPEPGSASYEITRWASEG
ncbi:hypothetical protein GCM10009741_62430 [Kribbella lupini]|uniref:Low molecular weight protein antigen 6 PH domain-containing protein n=1 Tax=Kribbella lupini TaxID=291602 RepID=A0ABN2BYI7_9ACTN